MKDVMFATFCRARAAGKDVDSALRAARYQLNRQNRYRCELRYQERLDNAENTQFEREFKRLPDELKAFWVELCAKEKCVREGQWQQDFAEGRHLKEMLEEWQLFYAQPAAVRRAWLCTHSGSFSDWLKTYTGENHENKTAHA